MPDMTEMNSNHHWDQGLLKREAQEKLANILGTARHILALVDCVRHGAALKTFMGHEVKAGSSRAMCLTRIPDC